MIDSTRARLCRNAPACCQAVRRNRIALRPQPALAHPAPSPPLAGVRRGRPRGCAWGVLPSSFFALYLMAYSGYPMCHEACFAPYSALRESPRFLPERPPPAADKSASRWPLRCALAPFWPPECDGRAQVVVEGRAVRHAQPRGGRALHRCGEDIGGCGCFAPQCLQSVQGIGAGGGRQGSVVAQCARHDPVRHQCARRWRRRGAVAPAGRAIGADEAFKQCHGARCRCCSWPAPPVEGCAVPAGQSG